MSWLNYSKSRDYVVAEGCYRGTPQAKKMLEVDTKELLCLEAPAVKVHLQQSASLFKRALALLPLMSNVLYPALVWEHLWLNLLSQ